MKIIGDSMSPLIPNNTEIFLENTMDFCVGDIVVFKDQFSNTFTAHRVISIKPFITKGDNSLVLDEPSKNDVFAKIIKVKRDTKSYTFNNKFINYLIAKISYYSRFTRIIRYPFKILLILYTKSKLIFSF